MMAMFSWRTLPVLALCAALGLLGGPGAVLVRGENMQECIDPADFDPEKDYFPHKAIVEVAELFSIEYHKHFKIVRNTEDDKTYVLVQCGAPAPSAEELAEIGVTDVDFTIDVPLTNVALQYSTMEAFFGMLGERRKVQAILGTSYSTESCMMELVDNGLIVELDDALASANASYVNEQGLLETNPNLEREFSVDNIVGFVGRTPWNAKEYPFPFVRSSTTLEPTREGLFEKVKFFATFLNKEERANYLWGQVQTRLDCVQANAAKLELEKGEMTKILWAGYSGYCKAWDVARTGPYYYHDFAKVCSAELLHAEMGGNLTSENEACHSAERKYMSPEEFYEFGKDADVWLWNGPSPPPLDDAAIFTEEVKAFKAFQAQEFYFPGGSTGWYDQANMQPDVLIEDICSIAGTLDLEDGSEYQRKWYSNVFTLDVNTPNPTCEELGGIDTPRETLGSNCAVRTAASGVNMQECIDPADFDPEKDYFPHKAIVEVAELFSIEYQKHYKIVRNTEDDKTYVLVQCGAPAPSAEELAAIGVTDVDFTIDVPLTNVALQYSTMEAFFGMLGERRKVQAILGTSYSTESCMMELVDEGLIVELDDELASANASYVNEQGLLATNPNLEREFSVDNIVGFVGRTPWNAKEYPFPFVRSSDTLEPTREGLFEKVKFYSTFLNKEERANYLWGQVQTRLDCVQTNAAEIELEKGEMTKILWAGYSGYCKAWDVARTGPYYYHDFAKVCSAELLHAEMGGNMVSETERCQSPERKYMSPEEFYEFGKDADVWLWNGPSPPPLDDAAVFTEEVKAFKAFQAQEFYFPGGSTGWFDQANIQPDVLIEDICSIAGTLDLEDGSEYQRKWYSNAFTLDVNTPNPTCEELGGIDTPRETLGSNCAVRAPANEDTEAAEVEDTEAVGAEDSEATEAPPADSTEPTAPETKATESPPTEPEATTSATEALAPQTEATEAPPPPATEATAKATEAPPVETEATEAPAEDTETAETVSSEKDSAAYSAAVASMTTIVAGLAMVTGLV